MMIVRLRKTYEKEIEAIKNGTAIAAANTTLTPPTENANGGGVKVPATPKRDRPKANKVATPGGGKGARGTPAKAAKTAQADAGEGEGEGDGEGAAAGAEAGEACIGTNGTEGFAVPATPVKKKKTTTTTTPSLKRKMPPNMEDGEESPRKRGRKKKTTGGEVDAGVPQSVPAPQLDPPWIKAGPVEKTIKKEGADADADAAMVGVKTEVKTEGVDAGGAGGSGDGDGEDV